MPRFVILTHDWPVLHWDLMLEADEPDAELWTWRLEKEPAAGEVIRAQRLPDHRREYLDYEGPVSGGRGSVTTYCKGTYNISTVQGSVWVLSLQGDRLSGPVRIEKGDEQDWQVIFGQKSPD